MTPNGKSIAIVGAGIGGLTAAIVLRRAGFHVDVYEQASRFARVGAGIQMGPNPMKVLRGIGLEEQLKNVAFEPVYWDSRDWDTGERTNRQPLKPASEEKYGAPYLLLHRADLHAALASQVPEEFVHRNHKLIDVAQDKSVVMTFADGTTRKADAVIAADGIHSTVRNILFGAESPRYVGRVAYRTTFPAALLGGYEIDDNTKWWGPDRHIVIYYVTRARDEVYFVTSVPEERGEKESWSQQGDVEVLRDAFRGFHPQVQHVLEACPSVNKWGIFVRDPMPSWHKGNIALLGDACHPMTPYMAQGAATAMEDAVVLTRCLEVADRFEDGFRRYELARQERTARIQATSAANKWLQHKTDTDWVYGYDAWNAPLPDSESLAVS